MVGAGYGISRLAPILQDIFLQLKNDPNSISVKRIDLYWIIEDNTYFEWFTKLLNELKYESDIFNFHIYFVDKSPHSFKEKLMYISTNASDKNTEVSLINNLWDVANFHLPNWIENLVEIGNRKSNLDNKVFYSGPRKYLKPLKKSCKKLGIAIDSKKF